MIRALVNRGGLYVEEEELEGGTDGGRVGVKGWAVGLRKEGGEDEQGVNSGLLGFRRRGLITLAPSFSADFNWLAISDEWTFSSCCLVSSTLPTWLQLSLRWGGWGPWVAGTVGLESWL